ncbi:hypothetical protein GY45DRAFT_1329084 [Cubamyces sp. BRFM 1775]|nr:hypothetical protein GY45DRAFT_1329084 [Cubamyces sp. BRFM 1775]
MRVFALAAALSAVVAASAKQIVITVGDPDSPDNGTTVFKPAEVKANIGDVVLFNFTQGNHSAIQSTFASPCIPAHDTNITINGFNSGLRPTNNGTAITNLPVTISTNDTIWFYDATTCAIGGVGGININDSSTATLAGFQRNAIRLNGTATSTSSSSSATGTSASGTGSGASSTKTPTGGNKTSSAEQVVVRAVSAVIPLALGALLF